MKSVYFFLSPLLFAIDKVCRPLNAQCCFCERISHYWQVSLNLLQLEQGFQEREEKSGNTASSHILTLNRYTESPSTVLDTLDFTLVICLTDHVVSYDLLLRCLGFSTNEEKSRA